MEKNSEELRTISVVKSKQAGQAVTTERELTSRWQDWKKADCCFLSWNAQQKNSASNNVMTPAVHHIKGHS